MMFVRDAPSSIPLTKSHSQTELQVFLFTISVGVDAVPDCRGESNILACGDFDLIKVKCEWPWYTPEKQVPRLHIRINPT